MFSPEGLRNEDSDVMSAYLDPILVVSDLIWFGAGNSLVLAGQNCSATSLEKVVTSECMVLLRSTFPSVTLAHVYVYVFGCWIN